MRKRVLHVKAGEPLEANLKRAAQMMQALERGDTPAAYFGIGFSNIGELFAVFTPRRWDLLYVLRQGGPMTIAELSRRLKRDYKTCIAMQKNSRNGAPLRKMKKGAFLRLIQRSLSIYKCQPAQQRQRPPDTLIYFCSDR